MGIKSKILFHQSSGMYERDLSSKIKSLVIPKRIFLKSSNDFDDTHIHNEGDRWVFYFSGSRRYVKFNLDEMSNAILKYFCFK